MSVSTKNRPSTVGGGGGSGGDEGVGAVGGGRCKETDDSEEEGDNNKDFGKNKGKRVSCFRFRKVKSTFLWRKRKGVSGNSERRRELSGGGRGGCYLCLKRPLTSDSGGESQTSDPNSPNFTYEIESIAVRNSELQSEGKLRFWLRFLTLEENFSENGVYLDLYLNKIEEKQEKLSIQLLCGGWQLEYKDPFDEAVVTLRTNVIFESFRETADHSLGPFVMKPLWQMVVQSLKRRPNPRCLKFEKRHS